MNKRKHPNARAAQMQIGLILSAIVILIGLVSECQGQVSIPMKTASLKEATAFVNAVITNTRSEFKIVEVDSIPDQTYGRVKFYMADGEYKSSEDIDFTVVFLKQTEGANKALEIEGKPVYYLLGVYSIAFLDIFPTWKQFVDVNANMENIATKGMIWVNRDLDGKQKRVGLEGNTDKSKWSLIIR